MCGVCGRTSHVYNIVRWSLLVGDGCVVLLRALVSTLFCVRRARRDISLSSLSCLSSARGSLGLVSLRLDDHVGVCMWCVDRQP